MTQEISQDFAFYLKSKGVYSNFIINAKRNKNQQQSGFFRWTDTTEGHDFWKNIFEGFVDFLNKKYNYKEVINE